MHFHANYVSTSVFGDDDYYQATFEAEHDADDPDSPSFAEASQVVKIISGEIEPP